MVCKTVKEGQESRLQRMECIGARQQFGQTSLVWAWFWVDLEQILMLFCFLSKKLMIVYCDVIIENLLNLTSAAWNLDAWQDRIGWWEWISTCEDKGVMPPKFCIMLSYRLLTWTGIFSSSNKVDVPHLMSFLFAPTSSKMIHAISARWWASSNHACSQLPHNSHMNILFIIKVKILRLTKWSYRSPNHVGYLA